MAGLPKRDEFVALMEGMGWTVERLTEATRDAKGDARKAFRAALNSPGASAAHARALFRAAVAEAKAHGDKMTGDEPAAGLLALFPE